MEEAIASNQEMAATVPNLEEVAKQVAEQNPEYFKREILEVIPLKRAATPSEIARAIIWLCSDDSAFMMGHNLVIDGGASL